MERPELPWKAPAGDAGATGLFLVLVILLVAVGLVLYVGTAILLPS